MLGKTGIKVFIFLSIVLISSKLLKIQLTSSEDSTLATQRTEVKTELLLDDQNLSKDLYSFLSPTFKLDDTYAFFYNEKSDKTRIIHFPDLKQETIDSFKGQPLINGNGAVILVDYERDQLLLVGDALTTLQKIKHKTMNNPVSQIHFFLEPNTFLVDGGLFKIENKKLKEIATLDAYQQKFGSRLVMIDSSRKDAVSYKDFVEVSCTEFFSSDLSLKNTQVFLTEKELPCLLERFDLVYYDERRDFIFFQNLKDPENSNSYFLLQIDLNRDNEEYLSTLIKQKRVFSNFEFLRNLSPEWYAYFYSFPKTSYSFSYYESPLNQFGFLSTNLGEYPMLSKSADQESGDTSSQTTLKLSETVSITAKRYCNSFSINECRPVKDALIFTTVDKKESLNREDAVLISTTKDEIFLITENGIEKVRF